MTDTIILEIPREKVVKLEGRFPEWSLQSRKKGHTKHIKNWFVPNHKSDKYYPTLTGYIRNMGTVKISTVYIQFNPNKLLFENNLSEVCEADFPVIVSTLRERLLEMGEAISINDLENAVPNSIHPSKNIRLDDGYTAQGVVKEIGKINVTKKLELAKVTFINEGHSLQVYSREHSLVFYDKIADLKKSSKKAIDRDQTAYQLSLFEKIRSEDSFFEVLRLEARLSKRKVNSMTAKLGYGKNLTFKEIFKKDICQNIVKQYWEMIIKGENLFLFEAVSEPKRLYRKMLRMDKKSKAKQMVYLVGLNMLCKDEGGIRDFRNLTEKRTGKRNWYRFGDDIKSLNRFVNKGSVHSWVKQVDETIKEFKPFRMGKND